MAQQATQRVSHQQEEARSAVERIGAFAAAARAQQLKPNVRQLFKRNILDSLGCAIAALPGRPFQALREQFEEYRAPGRCTLIGGGKTSVDQAALFNSSLTRYVDLLDSYMSPGGLCHPSDNFGAILAAAEQAGASGEEFMLALAVSHEIQCRFTAVVPVMVKGFDHASQLAMSVAAGAGKLFGLSAEQIANAISIATANNVSLACIHVEPVSQWKGFSPGWMGMRAVYAASMAKRGFTGPRGLLEGPKGLEQMFGQAIAVDWDDPSLDFVTQTVLRKYCSLIHGQPVIQATLDLRRSYKLDAADVEHVGCDIFQAGYDFAGGGNYGSKDHPWLKNKATTTSNTSSLRRCSTVKLVRTSWSLRASKRPTRRQWSRGWRPAPTTSSPLAFRRSFAPASRFAPRTGGLSSKNTSGTRVAWTTPCRGIEL
jgi:2-methylcitrate dehydratase